jgi:dTDP-4-dehydrorhamnose reductase
VICSEFSDTIIPLDIQDCDLRNEKDVRALFLTYNFDILINCAAFTAVDAAEEKRELAKAVNADALLYLARGCKEYAKILVHFSTDYVFNGRKQGAYIEEDVRDPINYYGYTKALAEEHIESIQPDYYLFRVQWLYGENGPNFIKTMLRLFEEKNELSVVNDQFGTPTSVYAIVAMLKVVLDTRPAFGAYHFRSDGQCSWYDFACFLAQEQGFKGQILPVNSTAFHRPAKRPSNGILDTTKISLLQGLKTKHWQEDVRDYLVKYFSERKTI